MVRPTFYSISLTFKCQLTPVLLARPQAVAGRIPWNRICPSLPPLWNCAWQPDFFEKLFLPWQLGKWPKKGFLNLKKNLVINFHWICSIMNMFIICCVPAQILYFGKSCSWDVGQNILSQSNCIISKWTISPYQIEQIWSLDS